MNHFSVFSLILLVPCVVAASSNDSNVKKIGNVTFVPGVRPQQKSGMLTTMTTTSNTSSNVSTENITTTRSNAQSNFDQALVESHNSQALPSSENNKKLKSNNPSTTSMDDCCSVEDEATTSTQQHHPATVVTTKSTNQNVSNYENKVGTAYLLAPALEQKNPYKVGQDGISKVLRRENSEFYVERIFRNGQLLSALQNKPDSNISDHMGRASASYQETLIQQSNSHQTALLMILEQQRKENYNLLSKIHTLLDAIKKDASNEILPSTIQYYLSTFTTASTSCDSLLETVTQEIEERKKCLKHLENVANEIKKQQVEESKK